MLWLAKSRLNWTWKRWQHYKTIINGPPRPRDQEILPRWLFPKTHHRAVVQDHHSGVTLVGLLSRLISTDRARHPMSVVASSILACVIGLRNQSNPLNTVQSATQIVNNKGAQHIYSCGGENLHQSLWLSPGPGIVMSPLMGFALVLSIVLLYSNDQPT